MYHYDFLIFLYPVMQSENIFDLKCIDVLSIYMYWNFWIWFGLFPERVGARADCILNPLSDNYCMCHTRERRRR